jgi:hypothetical protein
MNFSLKKQINDGSHVNWLRVGNPIRGLDFNFGIPGVEIANPGIGKSQSRSRNENPAPKFQFRDWIIYLRAKKQSTFDQA